MDEAISAEMIDGRNDADIAALETDYATLGDRLARHNIDINRTKERVKTLAVAIPTWGVGTGGTRFARFPLDGEPRNIFEKLDDCAVIQKLVCLTPAVSPHFPWDKVDDPTELKAHADDLGLAFDAVNSNTFQDQEGQPHSYKFGSLTHADKAVRHQAIAHNRECIDIGRQLGSKSLTVWIADGSNFPGQHNFADVFDRYLESMTDIYAALPDDWLVMIEHKLFEPAFYSTVIADWGTSYIAATRLGPKAKCLVDLGHHAPNTNIEMIVSRLAQAGKLGGFHFNDSKYGDDDLDTGSIDPFQLFLIFNELVDRAERDGDAFRPAYMLDQSHNVTDPIESLMLSAIEVARAYAKASLIDRHALRHAQDVNDAIAARECLALAYRTDVEPILAMARLELGGAIDPVATFRASGYRQRKAQERPLGNGMRTGII